MPADAQRRLVEFVQAGGKLLIAPLVPWLDETFRPCTVLAEFLGRPVQKFYPFPSPILRAYDVPNIYVAGDLFATESRPADAQTVAVEERSKKEIGWRRTFAGGGSVTVLGLHWKHAQQTHAIMLLNALKACGLKPHVECSNPYVWTSLRSDGKRTMLFVMNLFTAPMKTRVRYRDPVAGAWIDIGPQEIPPLTVRAWTDGSMARTT
jgi:hypothetical protein